MLPRQSSLYPLSRVYYYFYERSRGVVLSARAGSKGLNTLESMLVGLIAGSATTIISNPIWVVQTTQAVYSMNQESASAAAGEPSKQAERPGFVNTVQHILRKDGLTALWRGLGPALVLVINPIIQYTIFEQLKNFLVKSRTAKLRAGGAKTAVALLSDWDYFFLGALSKLSTFTHLAQIRVLLTCS